MMKRFLISVIWFIAFFFLSIFNISISDVSQPQLALPNGQPDARSLAPITSSTKPIKQHDLVLVAALDGTLSLIEVGSWRIIWSFKSGGPIYSSYQSQPNLNADQIVSELLTDFDSYIDFGDDGQLYKLSWGNDIKERLNCTVKDYLLQTPLRENGSIILGDMTTTTFIIDANIGAVRTLKKSAFSPSSPELIMEKNAIILQEGDKKLVKSGITGLETNFQQFTISRMDYMLRAYSEISGELIWNLTFAEFMADYPCQVLESPLQNPLSSDDALGPKYKSDFRKSPACRKSITVLRMHQHGSISVVGLIDGLQSSLLGDRVLPLPAADHDNLPALRPAYSGGPNSVCTDDVLIHSDKKLALPFPDIDGSVATGLPPVCANCLAGPSINEDSNATHNLWPLVLSGFLLLAAGFCIYYYVVGVPADKGNGDSKLKATVTKKRKTRKSVINRNNTGVDKSMNIPGVDKTSGSILNIKTGGGPDGLLDNNGGRSELSLTSFNGFDNGRKIGKLFVTNNEIAKGSNGTVVLDGVYDGRPVAVKRLVQTHHDVALKEIQNLIASDQHPNIVRWYGVEFDSDFVYLSLERCTCSLNDFIYLYSETSEAAMPTADMDSNSMYEYSVQLQQKLGHKRDFELWKRNGYPSLQLLKLMRDVVSGLVHLHELGIIHRDLKPQNVLIIKDKIFSAKLSDMGISKRLDGDMSSLTHHATGIGSSGWRAPEQLLHGRQSRAMDLFSLGCVLFFCVTGGKHPFGDRFERDVNIVKNEKDLFLVENIPEAVDLIARLLDPNPELRPKAMEVLHHPLFWSSDTRLSFLRDASDRVELEDRESESEVLKALEGIASSALGGKWDEKLETSFINNISKYRRYKYDSVRDLLRVIRNKLNHYRELPKEIQETLGSVPGGFDSYFMSRFPRLLIEVYKVIHRYCREEELLGKYFRSSVI
ncbi:hypothetical protein Ancab_007053 [Ancistrocladus abbreviatus]